MFPVIQGLVEQKEIGKIQSIKEKIIKGHGSHGREQPEETSGVKSEKATQMGTMVETRGRFLGTESHYH